MALINPHHNRHMTDGGSLLIRLIRTKHMCLYSKGTTKSYWYTLKQLFQPSPPLNPYCSSLFSFFVTLAFKEIEYYFSSTMGNIESGTTLLCTCVCWCATVFTACLLLSSGKSRIIKFTLPENLKGGLPLLRKNGNES